MHIMEFMEEGVLTTIIGMGVVFSVLIILSIFIKFLNSAVNAAESKKRVPDREIVHESPMIPVAATVTDTEEYQEGISSAVVAAITASICALTGKSAEEFRFKEIRRASGSQPMWAMVGTSEIMSTRQRFIERGNR